MKIQKSPNGAPRKTLPKTAPPVETPASLRTFTPINRVLRELAGPATPTPDENIDSLVSIGGSIFELTGDKGGQTRIKEIKQQRALMKFGPKLNAMFDPTSDKLIAGNNLVRTALTFAPGHPIKDVVSSVVGAIDLAGKLAGPKSEQHTVLFDAASLAFNVAGQAAHFLGVPNAKAYSTAAVSVLQIGKSVYLICGPETAAVKKQTP